MKITRTNNSTTNIELLVSVGPEELEPIHQHVVNHCKGRVKVPGFRAGTAPSAMVEKHIDQRLLMDEFMEHALNHLYREALKSEDIRPASKPDVQLKKFVPYTELEFNAKLDIIGKITLPDYKKIKLAKKPIKVTAADINGVLDNLRQRSGGRKAVDRAAKDGDEVTIDFKGTDKAGKLVSGAVATDYPLLLGSGNFIPGFEEKLIGLAAGESKNFTIKFPKDYGVKSLQSADVTFDITVKKVQEVVTSKLDDKFAAKVGPFKTLAELKADVNRQLITEKQNQADNEYKDELVKAISDKSKVEIPQSIVDEEIERSESEERRNLTYQGKTWDEHLKDEGITEQQHKERNKPDAMFRIKAGLVLSEIAEKENVEVLPEEVDIRIQLLKGQYQDDAMKAELDKPENRGQIEAQILTEKTIAKLVAYATASKV